MSAAKLREAESVIDRLLAWDSNVETLFAKFDGPETEACVAEGLLEEVKKLPRQLPWHSELNGSNFRARLASLDPAIAGHLAGMATRYAVSLKSIEKKLRDRMAQSVGG